MKLKNFLVSLLVTVTLFSCKNEEKKEADQVAIDKPVLDKNIFTVTLTAVVKKDDAFQLFFKNENNELPFDEKKSIFTEFKGSNQAQDIVFRLPEDEVPTFLRLDFGVNKNQSEVQVEKFKIEYLGKKFEIAGKDFATYFYGNELTKIDATTGTVTPITSKEGNYDPICASAEGLRKQIEILLKP